MNDQQKEPVTEREPFPYKTYDEILTEKARKDRLQHGLVVMTGIFLMLCAVVVGVSMVWNRSANPFVTPTGEEGIRFGETQAEQPATGQMGETEASFRLPAVSSENRNDASAGEEGPIYVTDVSGIVKKARASVVGIEAESYTGYVTSRTGSGIILSENGYIITNSHVISGCDSINVILDSGESYTAFIVGDDSYSDLAVLKIDAGGLTPAVLGDSDLVEVGQPAIAIGNPTGQLQGTTTFGIISGLDRNIVVNNTVMNLIQTDAAINTGNSGGPLLNQQGQVVGINSAKVSVSGYEGLGFSIPINTARPIAEELVRSGKVAGRPSLGIGCSRLSAMASSFYGLPQGLFVSSLDSGGGAAAAGLQVGDVITHIGDVRVSTMGEGYAQRNLHRAGDVISVTYHRRGVSVTVQVAVGDQSTMGKEVNF